MYKSIHTKDYKQGIIIEIFRKSNISISNIFKTGFHKWTDSHNTTFYSLVIHRFRIIFWKQTNNLTNNKLKYKTYYDNYMKEKDIKTIIPIVDPNTKLIIEYLNV